MSRQRLVRLSARDKLSEMPLAFFTNVMGRVKYSRATPLRARPAAISVLFLIDGPFRLIVYLILNSSFPVADTDNPDKTATP